MVQGERDDDGTSVVSAGESGGLSSPDARPRIRLNNSKAVKGMGSFVNRNKIRAGTALTRVPSRSRENSSGRHLTTSKLRWGKGNRVAQMRKNREHSFALQGDDDDASAGVPFDPLALLRNTPPTDSVPVQLRHGRMFRGWDCFVMELRAETILLYETSVGEWQESENYTSLVGLFSLMGTRVSRKDGTTVRVRKDGESASIDLRFTTDSLANAWEELLGTTAGVRVVGVSDFNVIAAIGKGASGSVFLVRDMKTGSKLALKSIEKKHSVFESRSSHRHAIDERLVMGLTDGHKCFVQLRYAFQTKTKIYLATEFCEGGDIFFYIMQNNGGLDEERACFIAAEVVLALEKLHEIGIIYRDLKPENILLDAEGHIRIADFGLCKLLKDDKLTTTGAPSPVSPDAGTFFATSPAAAARASGGVPTGRGADRREKGRLRRTKTVCGTHSYVAPEMLKPGGYDQSIDVWCLGIFIYHIMVGRPPFDAQDIDEVKKQFEDFDVSFFDDIMSPDAIALLKGLLEPDVSKRLGCGSSGIAGLKQHPFFRDIDWAALSARKGKHSGGLFTGPYAKPPSSSAAGDSSRNVSQDSGTSGRGDGSRDAKDMASPTSGLNDKVVFLDNKSEDDRKLLRNFDLSEWAHVKMDADKDEPTYGDGKLFPVFKARKREMDVDYIANFAFCCASSRQFER